MRAMTMKSSVTWAFLPAAILSAKRSMIVLVWSTSVPNSEFFFSPTLSSMIDGGDAEPLERLHREDEVLRLAARVAVEDRSAWS